MRKIILFLLLLLSFNGVFASSKKYNKETDPVYKGMINAFDIVAKTKDKKEETERNLQRFEVKSKLLMDRFQHPVKPNDREMITCAYREKMEEIDDSMRNYQSNNDQYGVENCRRYRDNLSRFGIMLGIK